MSRPRELHPCTCKMEGYIEWDLRICEPTTCYVLFTVCEATSSPNSSYICIGFAATGTVSHQAEGV